MIKFKKIKLHNFLSFKDQEFELDNKGQVLVLGQNYDSIYSGSNGSGKSALFEAIYYALYGTTLRNIGVFDVVHEDQKQATVELEFTTNGDSYKIVRSRSKNLGSLSVFVNDKDVSLKDMRETQKQIINKLMEPDIAKNAIFFSGSVFESFVNLNDADKKKIITSILGFDKIGEVREKVKKLYIQYEKEHTILSTKIDVIKIEIEENNQNLKKLAETDIEEIDKLVEHCREEIKKEEEDRQDNEKILKKHKEFVDICRKELDEIIEELRSKQISYTKKESILKHLQIESTKKKDLIEQGKCPTCGTEITQTTFEDKIIEIEDKIKKIDLKPLKEEIDELEYGRNETKGLINGYGKQVEQDTTNIKCCTNNIDNLKDLLNKKLLDKKEYNTKLQTLCDRIHTLEETEYEITLELERKQDQLDIYKFWVEGFGPQGITSYILDSYFPKFNKLLNQYLQVLFGSGIMAKFIPYTKLKSSDTIREKWDFEITGLKNYNAASSGERRRIDIGVLFALNSLVRELMGGCNILIVDEAMDPLDEIGTEKVVELLKDMDISSVFVITHNERLQEKFSNVYTVTKKNRISKLVIS